MCEQCDYKEYMEKIVDIFLCGPEGETADFLEGVYSWIEENKHITEDQKAAVDSIAEEV